MSRHQDAQKAEHALKNFFSSQRPADQSGTKKVQSVHSEYDNEGNTCCKRLKACCEKIQQKCGGMENSAVGKDTNVFVYIRKPLDGGYGWFMLFCGFVINLISDGMACSFGRVLDAIATDLKISVGEVTFAASLQNALYYWIGPFASAAANKLGFRVTCFVGSLFVIAGFATAAIAKTIEELCLYLGVLVGCGFGMCTSVSTLVVGFYFERYRAIAMGVCTAGTGVGTLLISLLNNYVVVDYGWRVALNVHAGLYAFVLVLSIFLKQVRPTKFAQIPALEDSGSSDDSVELDSERYSFFLSSMQSFQSFQSVAPYGLKAHTKGSFLDKCCRCFKVCKCAQKKPKPKPTYLVLNAGPLHRDDIFYAGSLQNLPEYALAQENRDRLSFIADRDQMKSEKLKSLLYTFSVIKARVERSQRDLRRRCQCLSPSSMGDVLGTMFDCSIIRLVIFQDIFISSFLFSCGFTLPFFFIKRRAHLPDNMENYLVSTIGMTNIFFRLSWGLISYKMTSINPAQMIAIPLMLAGVFSIFSAHYGQDIVWFQFTYCAIFAWGSAAFLTLRTVLFVNALGLSRLTNVFGLSSFSMGLGTFCGTATGGFLVDITGSYDAPFIVSGWSLLSAGAMISYIPAIQRNLGIEEQLARTKSMRV